MDWNIEQLQYDSTVIKPPNKNKDLVTRYLYVDSRDRNYNTIKHLENMYFILMKH